MSAKKFLLHHVALGERCRNVFKARLAQEQPALFSQVPAKVWRRPWNVGCQAAGSGENALRYLARYVFKSATANKTVRLQPDGQVRWDYRDSKTGQPAAVTLAPLVWMSRFLQHVLPRGFARVRTFGWLHPAAKVRANRVRALLGENPVLTPAEQAAWQPPLTSSVEPDLKEPLPEECGPLCPRCHQKMRRVGAWLPGQPMLLPKQPP